MRMTCVAVVCSCTDGYSNWYYGSWKLVRQQRDSGIIHQSKINYNMLYRQLLLTAIHEDLLRTPLRAVSCPARSSSPREPPRSNDGGARVRRDARACATTCKAAREGGCGLTECQSDAKMRELNMWNVKYVACAWQECE